jgi:hypothetical protein
MKTSLSIIASTNCLCITLSTARLFTVLRECLDHTVGQGYVEHIMAKLEVIAKFLIPTNKKALMRFLGMTGLYRKLCPNFSSTVTPLTYLVQKKSKFE